MYFLLLLTWCFWLKIVDLNLRESKPCSTDEDHLLESITIIMNHRILIPFSSERLELAWKAYDQTLGHLRGCRTVSKINILLISECESLHTDESSLWLKKEFSLKSGLLWTVALLIRFPLCVLSGGGSRTTGDQQEWGPWCSLICCRRLPAGGGQAASRWTLGQAEGM